MTILTTGHSERYGITGRNFYGVEQKEFELFLASLNALRLFDSQN